MFHVAIHACTWHNVPVLIRGLSLFAVIDLVTHETHTFTTYNVAWAFAQTLSSYSMTFTVAPSDALTITPQP